MKKIRITESDVELLFESPFIRVFDIRYAPGQHYYDATRRTAADLTATMPDREFRGMTADAVSCFVVIAEQEQQPKLLLTREYRYPVGRFVLSVPAGLIDKADLNGPEPVITAAIREIGEETGIVITEHDTVKMVNPLLFSSPGMTDESNALVCAVVHPTDGFRLTQEGASEAECFDGFVPVTRSEAQEILRAGRDAEGNFYPVYTWMALMYFVSGIWEEQEN